MAGDLARRLNVKIVLVPITWGSLMADLASAKSRGAASASRSVVPSKLCSALHTSEMGGTFVVVEDPIDTYGLGVVHDGAL